MNKQANNNQLILKKDICSFRFFLLASERVKTFKDL